ncbi:penicillin-binding protein 1C [Flavobacterium sp. 90]|uniref:penicillin-binding protein 1C n=1 Tax=unclassified Flavobacterium TaxID=196869 RepID=UPI000EAB499B|nr:MULTISPECIES: penicillin-binding protein 1C [unclassified Flavobacterium]RKR09631.1 penicillin-binding protein 1C [Flavobacterium sp. 81]TCK53415.1 penicillin-binding protein 1C [Flavobacterium sp. 90]
MKNKLIAFIQRIINWIKKNKIKSAIVFLLLLIYYFSLPRTLFQEPYSTVIESKEGELLGAKIARDGQWRFPAQDSVPDKFKKCIVYFEDEYFYKHLGFNPVAMVNAIKQNRKAGKVVRGGSTLTQQVIRLSRKGKGRTYFEKIIEIILATRLELGYSKDEILELYAAHAPFGGNVVGLEMASWRYFGVQSNQLSWAENATLAVLPNAPSLIYPGKNQIKLLNKRNRLLLKLHKEGIIDKQTYELSVEEPLPQKPYDLPQIAPHLLQRVAKEDEGTRVKTTVDYALQNRVNQIARYYYNQYKQNEVNNLAILVIDVSNRNVMSYVGNSPTDKDHQKDVDIIDAPRSTGSILKPLLYAAMLDDGELLPNTLVADIPTQIAGYTPQNFNLTFDGAVPAHRALSRSLNIPAVLMLQDFGVNKFYEELQKFKLRDINKTPDHYGLSLILGGAESNLWDLCRTYANLSSTVNYYTKNQEKYRTKEFTELNFRNDFEPDFGSETDQKNTLGAGSIWLTYNAMEEVNRPEGDEAWKFYDSSLKIAWKTGTSFGNRDAWAIGTNSKYVVGIWVGNATGEGRPTLTGVTSAAPILFDVFNLLPRQKWFQTPYKDLDEVEVCRLSGYLAKDGCPKIKQWVPKKGKSTVVCPYHKTVHLDKTEKFQVNSSCESIDNIVTKNWFILPPVMAWYYKSQHIEYLPLPPFKEDCQGTQSVNMDFIYPKTNSKIYLTKNFNSEVQPVILKVAYSERDKELFWYVDDVYKATTKTFHELPITSTSGIHYITVVDASGNEIRRRIEIVRE